MMYRFFCLLLLLGFSTPLFGTETSPITAEFTKMLLEMDDVSWDTLGSEQIPLEQQQEPVYDMMNRLRTTVPKSFLQHGISPLPQSFSALVLEEKLYRGRAFELKGTATWVEELPLNPMEQKKFRLPKYFRCRLSIAGNRVDLLTPTVPVAWKRNEPISENIAATGLYIKRFLPKEHENKDESTPTETDILEGKTTDWVPLCVAPEIEWYPDTLLGQLGMDVGSLDQIPVLRIGDLKKKELPVAEPFEMLDRSEFLRRAFKFTDADQAPFYGLLRACKNAKPGQLGAVARTAMEKDGKTEYSATKLFTQPAEQRNNLVLLYGTAKRVIPTLVENKEIRDLYGIDKYYQIYFFTEDARENPLVACVAELPPGMPVGSGPDYSERISIAGFFYKLWVYESSAVVEKSGKEGETYKPNFAPLLIGRNPDWYPSPKNAKAVVQFHGGFASWSLTVFAVLALAWFSLHFFRSKKPIEFKMRR